MYIQCGPARDYLLIIHDFQVGSLSALIRQRETNTKIDLSLPFGFAFAQYLSIPPFFFFFLEQISPSGAKVSKFLSISIYQYVDILVDD